MTGAHWLILAAAAAVAAVLCLWWTRRHPRIRGVDAELTRAERDGWVDEPGDPTHEQIDQALVIVQQCCDLHNRNCEPPSELCCWECTEIEHPLHRTTDCIAPDLSMPFAEHTDAAMRRLIGDSPISEDRKSDLLGEWHDRLEHTVPWPHLTAEEAADCTRCSPSSLPRRIEGGGEHG